MSIYATNFIVDEETGEAKLVKHLNKIRVDRWTTSKRCSGKWNKSGIVTRELKGWRKHIKETRKESKMINTTNIAIGIAGGAGSIVSD